MAVKKTPTKHASAPATKAAPGNPGKQPGPDSGHAYGKCSYSYGASPASWPQHGYDPRNETPPPKGPIFTPGRFGRMFPNLPGLNVDAAALQALGEAMLDPAGPPDPAQDNLLIPSGFTYLGQFIDHDITFDPTSMPEVLVDPLAVFNFRTPKLDLDSVYGTGPATQPYLYESRLKLLVGATQAVPGDPGTAQSRPNDLLRLNRTAVIGDPRNDENLVVAQTHLAFIKFHNKCVDTLMAAGFPAGGVFTEARRLVTWHYQRLIVDDFLARICDQAVLDDVMQNGRKFFDFSGEAFMPVEFSVAAYRFGHSQVRNGYNYNRVFNFAVGNGATLAQLFQFTAVSGPDGPGNIPVPSNWIIDWRRFYDLPGAAVAPDPTRKIDPLLVSQLHALPGGRSLPLLNLTRGVRMGLPSGQAVAAAMQLTPLTPQELGSGPDGQVLIAQGLGSNTPLWYYLLKEAQVQQNGDRLGQVGSRIVAETFIGLLDSDALSFRRQNPLFEPSLFKPGATPTAAGKYTMADLLTFVDEINPIGD